MKNILLSLGLMLLAVSARATVIVPTPVMEVANSSITVVQAIVSPANCGRVDLSTTTMSDRRVLEIENVDATANLWCMPTPTCTTSAGHKIVPGESWILSMAAWDRSGNPLTIYCINDGGGAATKAQLTQMN